MKVSDWQDVLTEVAERDVDPDGWRAVAGDRQRGLGEDLYLGHPAGGVYLLKTYAKNPFEVRGTGTRVARRIDDDLEPFFPDRGDGGRFGVQQPVADETEAEQKARHLQEVVQAHADAPTDPGALFDDVMETLESPAFGPMTYDQFDRPDPLDDLAGQFEEAEDLLTEELDDLIETDGVEKGFQ